VHLKGIRIEIHRPDDLDSGLLHAQRETTHTAEKIYTT
jgi:hypothetical protein